MLVTPLVLIQIFSKRMLVDWPKCWSVPQDEGHLACLSVSSKWNVCRPRNTSVVTEHCKYTIYSMQMAERRLLL